MQQSSRLSNNSHKNFALFELGFRPFFFFSSLFSVIATIIWMANYSFNWVLPISETTPVVWHGHEMVFGYTIGIISGFLLTAVRNWTGISTIKGLPLIILVTIWLLARILPLLNSSTLFVWAGVCDILFLIIFIITILYPIIKAQQWPQLIIITKLVLILAANILYYLGVFNIVEQGISWGLYSAVYLEMAIIFILARRVIPFFIERGVQENVQLKNWPFIDASSLIFLAALWISDIFLRIDILVMLLTVILTFIHSFRLWCWHTRGIWKTPLLWVLYIGYSIFILGFALKAMDYFFPLPHTLPLHAFTYGGIGMITMGMISRVSLGHTGRNIMEPPKVLSWIFASLFLGTIIRVIAPILYPGLYLQWIGISQALWIASFSLFIGSYSMILIKKRVDGKPN
ncbi:MAG: NnrS family protein [Piscirickettsiaceae bacterium]|nr:NnrS family protein [Piscirickettsiaceae bacterium]